MLRVGIITAAFVVAVCTPWLIVKTDLNTAIHTLPGGWSILLFHSIVVIHSPRNHPYTISLKDVFVSAAIVILVALIIAAAVRERRASARGFDIEMPAAGATDSTAQAATQSQSS